MRIDQQESLPDRMSPSLSTWEGQGGDIKINGSFNFFLGIKGAEGKKVKSRELKLQGN